MKKKLKNLFHVIIQVASTMTIAWDDERRMPLDGGGFAQDSFNLRHDASLVMGNMANAIWHVKSGMHDRKPW